MLRLIKVGDISIVVDSSCKVASTCTVPGLAGDEGICECGVLYASADDFEISENDGKYEWRDSRVRSIEVYQVGLHIAIPEETVVDLALLVFNLVNLEG